MSPAAGPLTWRGLPASGPTTSPPMTPVMTPASAGSPQARAMAMHSGSATRNTTREANRSARSAAGRPGPPAGGGVRGVMNVSGECVRSGPAPVPAPRVATRYPAVRPVAGRAPASGDRSRARGPDSAAGTSRPRGRNWPWSGS